MSWIAAGTAAVSIGAGVISKSKANKEAKKLAANRPEITDSPYLNDQLSLAKSELANGMSSQAENAYQQGTDRSLSASLNAILKGGGSVNNVADVFDQSEQGRARLSLMNDNLRLAQINNLVKSQDANEQFRQQQFGLNDYKPYADSAAANAGARVAADNQIWSGINSLGSTLAGHFGAPKYGTDSTKNISGNAPQLSNASMQTVPLTATPSVAGNYATLPSTIAAPALNYNSLNVTPTANAGTGFQGIPYAAPPERIPQYADQFDF